MNNIKKLKHKFGVCNGKTCHICIYEKVDRYRKILRKNEEAPEDILKSLLMQLKREIIEREEQKGRAKKGDVYAWKIIFGNKMKKEVSFCEKCGGKYDLTLDHIVPNFVLKDMGIDTERYNDERNFRILCKFCNGLKGSHLDFTDLRTKPMLISLLNQIEGTEDFEEAFKQQKLKRKNDTNI